jgi:putative GTP pyrophosphokinase
LKKNQKEAILIAFLKEKEKYKKLAEYIVHLIQDDPSSPKESLHAIIYRIKDELRLIEKIAMLNERLEVGAHKITEKNYQANVGDLLGIRIICLRLSDVEKFEVYLKLLSEESILEFVESPDPKKSFLLMVDPGESILDGADPRYTGYSSIHYQIKLGQNSDAPPALKDLCVELQLRTILEEAWSEIDHKYRYVHSRSGKKLPEHLHAGFYHLSAYLEVAAHQAEYLCRLAESHRLTILSEVQGNASTPNSDQVHSVDMEADAAYRKLSAAEIETSLEAILGVQVTHRTMIYIEKRLGELTFEKTKAKTLHQLLSKNRILEFKTIFQEIFGAEPFLNAKEHSIDVINAVNFAIFSERQGKRVAQEGLRVVLKWRKDRLIC